MVQVSRCACGCGQSVARKGATGRPAAYASGACRVRALRRRRNLERLAALPDTVPAPDLAAPVTVTVASGSTDDQVARSLLEAKAIGFALQRLGTQARPELAWRCTKLGEAITAAVAEFFPEVER